MKSGGSGPAPATRKPFKPDWLAAGEAPSFASDWTRARWDIEFFATRFLGFKPHPGQIRFWRLVLRRASNATAPAYLDINVSAGNRAGKTLMLAVAILHSTLFKIGLPSPNPYSDRDVQSWLSATYDWYHFAIQQETSELVYYELVRLLSGSHEAQQRGGCPLLDELGQIVDWSRKYRGEYLWMVVHPAFGGGNIHFRTTAERGIGSLGKDMHGISFDECAFDPNLTFIINEVLHLRRLSTGGQLILVSTPTEGLTEFADRWFEGDPDAPDRKVGSISMRMSARDNVGFGIEPEMFDRLIAGLPKYLIPQNVDGEFIEGQHAFFGGQAVDAAFIDGMDEQTLPRKGHTYVQGVDPALTFDSTYAIVLDITNRKKMKGVRIARRSGRQTVMAVTAVAAEGHSLYGEKNYCVTAIDSTGFGGAAIRDQLSGHRNIRSVEFGGVASKKLKLLTDLKGALERNELVFPRTGAWLTLRRQLLGYILKDDRRLKTDAIMALAVALHEALRTPANGLSVAGPFDFWGATPVRAGGVGSVATSTGPMSVDEFYRSRR